LRKKIETAIEAERRAELERYPRQRWLTREKGEGRRARTRERVIDTIVEGGEKGRKER